MNKESLAEITLNIIIGIFYLPIAFLHYFLDELLKKFKK